MLRNELSQALLEHYSNLLGFVRRKVRSGEVAQDIVQETWLRISTLPQEQGIDNPRAFLYRVANNLALDYLRQDQFQRRYLHDEEISDTISDPTQEQERRLIAQQQLERINMLIEQLPPKCREAFLLRKVRHWEVEQIANHMGISKNMVEKYLRRALTHCQQGLQRDEE